MQRPAGDVGVARIAVLAVLAARLDRRRRGVVAAPPRHELLFAVLFLGLGLVQALQRAVVALVEPPVAMHRDPVPVGLVQREVGGVDRPSQQRRVEHIGLAVQLLDQLAGAGRFGPALLGEVDVDPSGEQVQRVPLALAVAQQNQRGISHDSDPLTRRDQSSSSIRCANACRFFSDSPRDTRHSHSFWIDDRKPNSSNVLKSESTASSTWPSTRSISSAVTELNDIRPTR